jgi:hypothetical protein
MNTCSSQSRGSIFPFSTLILSGFLLIVSPALAQQAPARPPMLGGLVTFTAQGGDAASRTVNQQTPQVIANFELDSIDFLPAVTYSTGGHNPYSVAIADLNGDHNLDMVIANQGNYTEGSVSVLMGNGDGTFQPASVYDSGAELAYSVVIADVNGDGKPDLVIGESCDGSDCSKGGVGVFIGNGDGTFQPVVIYPLKSAAFYGSRVAVADLNGDGKLDVAVSMAGDVCCSAGVVDVLLGKGNGSFQGAKQYGTGGYNGPGSVAIGDVNGDGKPDLVVVNYCSTACGFPPAEGSVGVLLGNGDGTFQNPVTYDTGGQGSISVAIANLTRNGYPDLVVTSCGSQACGPGGPGGTVAVLLNKGDGTFESAKGYKAGTSPFSVVAADVNNDGKLDVVASNWGTSDFGSNAGAVTVLLGKGNGQLEPAVTYPSGGAESPSVAVVDLNSDGKLDIALACVDDSLLGTEGVASILINDSALPAQKTTTTVTTSGSPSFAGEAVTFTASVIAKNGTVPNSGLVTFFDGKNQLATVPLSEGMASYTTSALTVKTHTIKATYAGDANFQASSGSVKQVVELYATTTALTSSPNPSTSGQAVTFTATVSSAGPVATGKVVFKDGTKSIGSATLNGGVATLVDSKLAVGTHVITAIYDGDSDSGKSTSQQVSQVVNQ